MFDMIAAAADAAGTPARAAFQRPAGPGGMPAAEVEFLALRASARLRAALEEVEDRLAACAWDDPAAEALERRARRLEATLMRVDLHVAASRGAAARRAALDVDLELAGLLVAEDRRACRRLH